MKRIVIAFLSTISGLVLLMAYPTSTNRTIPLAATGPGTGGAAPASAGATAPTTAAAPAAGAAPASTAKDGTYTGAIADTAWGQVQVRIVVSGGKITQASAPVIPHGNGRDAQINSYAVPQLNSEVVQAQNGQIDMISGATVTSGGYLQSLQDAINQAFK
jgi:uncharacterized protein with FMN-binding domain